LGNGLAGDSFQIGDPVLAANNMPLMADELADTCALRGGQALCWGRNDQGQAGTDSGSAEVSAKVVLFVDGGPTTGLSSLRSIGDGTMIAQMPNGQLVGWGNRGGLGLSGSGSASAVELVTGAPVVGVLAQMGLARSEIRPDPAANISNVLQERQPQVNLGAALVKDGGSYSVTNWGALVNGLDNMTLAPPGTVLAMAQSVDADNNNAAQLTRCFATTEGIFCRGRNQACQAGVSAQKDSGVTSFLTKVESTDDDALKSVKQLVAGLGFFCALTQSNQVFFWGTNRALALGRQVNLDGGGARQAVVQGLPFFPDAAAPYPADCRAAPVEQLTPN
jgi:hypothetical protein